MKSIEGMEFAYLKGFTDIPAEIPTLNVINSVMKLY